MRETLRIIVYALLLSLVCWLGSCGSPPEEETPCEPVTVYVVPNYDSALNHFAPYTNLISDTSIYRTQIAELRAEILAVTVINGKLRTRLAKAAQDIAFQHEQLRHCIFVKDTAKVK